MGDGEEKDDLTNYGDFIRQRRKELHLTQQEVADKAMVHRTTVIDVEKNRPVHIDIFLSVIDAVGLKMELAKEGTK